MFVLSLKPKLLSIALDGCTVVSFSAVLFLPQMIHHSYQVEACYYHLRSKSNSVSGRTSLGCRVLAFTKRWLGVVRRMILHHPLMNWNSIAYRSPPIGHILLVSQLGWVSLHLFHLDREGSGQSCKVSVSLAACVDIQLLLLSIAGTRSDFKKVACTLTLVGVPLGMSSFHSVGSKRELPLSQEWATNYKKGRPRTKITDSFSRRQMLSHTTLIAADLPLSQWSR